MKLTRRAYAARVAALSRSRDVDDVDLLTARRDLWVAAADQLLDTYPAGAPHLPDEQADDLVDHLRQVLA